MNSQQMIKKVIHMKKKSLTILIFIGVACLLISCAGAKFIPEGSQSLGVYEGSFNSDMYQGSLRIHLFQTPEGDKLFEANFLRDITDPTVRKAYFVRGKMTANSLEGEMQGDFSGNLTGKLSQDGNRLTGSYNITTPDVDNGTWKAQKK
jgi:hypothetical protein